MILKVLAALALPVGMILLVLGLTMQAPRPNSRTEVAAWEESVQRWVQETEVWLLVQEGRLDAEPGSGEGREDDAHHRPDYLRGAAQSVEK